MIFRRELSQIMGKSLNVILWLDLRSLDSRQKWEDTIVLNRIYWIKVRNFWKFYIKWKILLNLLINYVYLDTNSDILDRTVISTYGSFIAQSLIDWTKQVVTLVQNDAFFPHPIRRELKSILELFTEKNMGIEIKHKLTDLNQCIHSQSQ